MSQQDNFEKSDLQEKPSSESSFEYLLSLKNTRIISDGLQIMPGFWISVERANPNPTEEELQLDKKMIEEAAASIRELFKK